MARCAVMLEIMTVKKNALAATVMGLALSVALTGCFGSSPAPSPSESTNPPDPTAVTPVDFEGLDPTLVDGVGLDGVEDQERRQFTNWFVLPQVPGLTEAQAAEVKAQTEKFYGEASTVQDDSFNSLSINPSFVAISPAIVGVRLTSFGRGETQRTLWYDVAAKKPLATKDLFAGQTQWDALRALAAAAVKKTGQALPAVSDKLNDDQLRSVTFSKDGSAVIESSSGTVAPGEIGGFAVTVPASDTKPLLSDAGKKAADAAAAPQRIVVPGSSSSATATPSTGVPPTAEKVDCAVAKCVALTFDDGPGLKTPTLLQYLRDQKVKATFYVLGSKARLQPNVVREAYNDGNEIASHTWSHSQLTAMPLSQAKKEIDDTAALITSLIGKGPASTRPPYGATNDAVSKLSNVPVVNWDVDTLDWQSRNAAAVTNVAVSQAKSGSIILMHDIHPTTIDAVPGMIQQLKANGFTLVTVSQILASQNPQPGVLYTKGK